MFLIEIEFKTLIGYLTFIFCPKYFYNKMTLKLFYFHVTMCTKIDPAEYRNIPAVFKIKTNNKKYSFRATKNWKKMKKVGCNYDKRLWIKSHMLFHYILFQVRIWHYILHCLLSDQEQNNRKALIKDHWTHFSLWFKIAIVIYCLTESTVYSWIFFQCRRIVSAKINLFSAPALFSVCSTLSWWRSLTYRNQFNDLLSKSLDWFL